MTPLDDRFARELPEMAIAWKAAVPPAPQLLLLNEPVATSLGLDPEWLRTPEGIRFLSGVGVPAVAQAYAGHQFGGFNPRLGDGRAVLLGSVEGRDLHLKGSGATPFSRGGDGFAAVGPMLREYVVSEAMHALGVPTTRALAVIATGAPVQRETVLPGALLARVATSHLRVGSFQFARATDDLDLLTRLAAHADSRSPLELFSGVVAAQASLIAQWMLLGFIHGVMNTDNMTIFGETIDYGPCAFMEAFDPATVFSSIDREGRYAYGQQPLIGEWNLTRLAEAMLPLFSPSEDEAIALATDVLRGYRPAYGAAWQDGMRAKLGLVSGDVASLAADLQEQMHQSRIDHTSFFRRLASSDPSLRDDFVDRSRFDAWLSQWSSLSPDVALMDRVNPVYIPRNHLLEEALSAATLGDLSLVQRLLEAVTSPYDEVPGFEKYALPGDLPDYQTFCGT